jgi:hypothetical protein
LGLALRKGCGRESFFASRSAAAASAGSIIEEDRDLRPPAAPPVPFFRLDRAALLTSRGFTDDLFLARFWLNFDPFNGIGAFEIGL